VVSLGIASIDRHLLPNVPISLVADTGDTTRP
jgi:hypothetical protein